MSFELLSLFGLVTRAQYDGNNIDTVHRHSWHYITKLWWQPANATVLSENGSNKKEILQKQGWLNVGKYGWSEGLQHLAYQLVGNHFAS